MHTIPTETIIIAVLLSAVSIAVIAWFIVQRRRSARLNRRLGPEYDLSVTEFRSRAMTEEELSQWEQQLFGVVTDRVPTQPAAHQVPVHS